MNKYLFSYVVFGEIVCDQKVGNLTIRFYTQRFALWASVSPLEIRLTSFPLLKEAKAEAQEENCFGF